MSMIYSNVMGCPVSFSSRAACQFTLRGRSPGDVIFMLHWRTPGWNQSAHRWRVTGIETGIERCQSLITSSHVAMETVKEFLIVINKAMCCGYQHIVLNHNILWYFLGFERIMRNPWPKASSITARTMKRQKIWIWSPLSDNKIKRINTPKADLRHKKMEGYSTTLCAEKRTKIKCS